MDYVSHAAPLERGETVVTAGSDGTFPPDFVVGAVERVSPESGELKLRVDVTPAVTARELECVEILLWRPAEPPPPVPDFEEAS